MLPRNRTMIWATSFLFLLVTLATAATAQAAVHVTVDKLTVPGQKIIPSSPTTLAFGINAYTDGESATISQMVVEAFDDGLLGGPPDLDPDTITADDFASFTLYYDNGAVDGAYDPLDTPLLTVNSADFSPPDPLVNGLAFSVDFSPLALPVPIDDTSEGNVGYDYFIVFQTSGTIAEDDSFFLRIPADSIVIPPDTFPAADVDTDLITVVVAAKVTATVKALGGSHAIVPGSGPVEVFGIDASSDSPAYLSSITIRVDDFGETSKDGLYEITPSDFLSFQVYRDGPSEPVGRNGKYDPPNGLKFAPDSLVAEVIVANTGLYPYTNTPFYVTIPLPENSYLNQLPPNNTDTFAGDDFFVCVRTSDTIDSDFYINGDISQIDDFTLTVEPGGVVARDEAGVFYSFPAESAQEVRTGTITTEGAALDLRPLPMDEQDYRTRFILFPGCSSDQPDNRLRYEYSVLGENLRWRYLGERDVNFSGISQNSIEAYYGQFEQPVVVNLDRRHDFIGLDVAGGTSDNPEYLTGLTLTVSNLGSYLQSQTDFDPDYGVDEVIGNADDIWWLFFSGLAIYRDSNNNGLYDEPPLNPDDFSFNTSSGDQPLYFDVSVVPGGSGPYPYNTNTDKTHYMVQIHFLYQDDSTKLETAADGKPDFFIVMRLDSGKADDSTAAGDGTAANFGADFKLSLERAEDFDGDGIRETPDWNNDGLPQTPPVTFQEAGPREDPDLLLLGVTPPLGITLLADNSENPLQYLGARHSDSVMNGEDLSMDYGYDLLENDPGLTRKIVQRIDATSPPTALLAIDAATSDVPQLNLIDMPLSLTEMRVNFSGEGFEPSDIKSVLLVRDDKSPYLTMQRSVGVFDIFNDLWNMPPPDAPLGAATNRAEESPIPVTQWTWQNDGSVDYLVLKPVIPPRIYPDDEIEEDDSVDNYADNYEMIQSEYGGIQLPRDKVYTGADYFLVIETSDSIAYDDEIKVQIPRSGVALSNGLTVFDGTSLFNPEDRSSDVRSVRANVPVELHDLVASGQELGPNSGYIPVLGFNMYTNRPPASQGGVDVYFEQLVVAFLQYGTRDSLSLASDFLPFENVNGAQTVDSGIQLYRDANGNGRFDGPTIDTLVTMDDTSGTLGPNPSRVGIAGDEDNQVLMVFSSDANRQLVPPTDTGPDAGDDFFLVIRTSSTFNPIEDNFSVAVISWGPDSPFAPAPDTIIAGTHRPYEAISRRQRYPWGRRGIGFVDSNDIRTRSTETINTNVFNATRVTLLNAPTDFVTDVEGAGVTEPTHQALLTWTDTNSDDPDSTYINENESGYWIEANIFGDFQPLPTNPLPADATQLLFDGPEFLAGQTVQFRIYPFRNNIFGNPLYPPFNGPGPAATTSVTFWPSLRPQPFASFSFTPATGCAPLSICFTDTSSGNPTSWSWDFGDGSTSTEQSPCHMFAAAGTYEVCLTVTNSYGSDTDCSVVTLNAAPAADFTANRSYACLNQPVAFTDLSSGNPFTYSWNFGDGGTSSIANPEHTYTQQGTFTVSLTVSNSCGSDSETKTGFITVAAGLQSDFSYSPVGACAPVTIHFTDGSTCEANEWSWDFGDGSTSTEQNPDHLYSSTGTYSVCLTVGNGITSDTHCEDVVISSCTPAIALSTNVLNNACKLGTNAPQQTFTVRNSGTSTLNYTILDNAYWVNCSPTTGTSTGEADTITVSYPTALMATGTYHATIRVSATGATNSPQDISVTLTVGTGALTKIHLIDPGDAFVTNSPPTFTWTQDGGTNNAFAVDVALSPTGPWYSSYANLHQVIRENSWAMPSTSWSKISTGKLIYWRVRGVDLDQEPRTVVYSDEVWSFYKQ